MTLAVTLQTQKPIRSTAFVHLQKQPVAVLVCTRTCHSCLNCQSCKLFHRVNPKFSPHTWEADSRRSKNLSPHSSHSFHCAAVIWNGMQRTEPSEYTLGFLPFLGNFGMPSDRRVVDRAGFEPAYGDRKSTRLNSSH